MLKFIFKEFFLERNAFIINAKKLIYLKKLIR